jgi:nitroimidazol reductase NimA-like FMN-containing flavoprotein (pyridoxamine 5'-phosphate oxidase superfamily)
MAKDYLEQAYNELRRKDRAMDDDWIRAFLHRAPVGVMATSYQEQPFINTRLFVYDEAAHAIYLHGAKTGRTPAIIAKNHRVCFSVSEMGRLIPADEAVEVSVEFGGVVVFGRIITVESDTESQHALQLLMDKYFPHLKPEEDYRPTSLQDLKITAVFRIDIESWSGKEKKVMEEGTGAFYYGEKR